MDIQIREKNDGPSITIKKNGETLVESGKPTEKAVEPEVVLESIKKID